MNPIAPKQKGRQGTPVPPAKTDHQIENAVKLPERVLFHKGFFRSIVKAFFETGRGPVQNASNQLPPAVSELDQMAPAGHDAAVNQ